MKLSVEDIYAWDENAAWLGLDLGQLMENAGSAVARAIHARYGQDEKGLPRRLNIAVLTGPGNNGGDGFVAARHLSSVHDVTVFALSRPERIHSNAARKNFTLIKSSPFVRTTLLDHPELIRTLDLGSFDLIVDAMLGAGKTGQIREPFATAIERINAFRGRTVIVSIDVPSGFPDIRRVQAHHTYTFEWDKKEYDFPRDVLPIGYPPELYHLIGPYEARKLLPKHGTKKGDHGNLLIIGGSSRYPGAPLLSARSALPFVDRVVLATPETDAFIPPSIIPVRLPGDLLTPEALDVLKPLFPIIDAIVIGPGLGRAEQTLSAVHALLRLWDGPLLIDADALYALPSFPADELRSERCLLTPHRGEMKMLAERLTGETEYAQGPSFHSQQPANEHKEVHHLLPSGKILYSDLIAQIEWIQPIARTLKSTILLKGPYDLIVPEKGSRFRYNITGTRALTTAGTGDMLAGVSGALLARGGAPALAGGVATFLLGLTAENLEPTHGAFIPVDALIEALPIVAAKLLKDPAFLKRIPDDTELLSVD